MMITRRIPMALLLVTHLAAARQDATPWPSTIPTPALKLIPSAPSPPANPYQPGSDWSLSAEQLDLVNRRIRSTEEESLVTTMLPPVQADRETTTLPPVDYEETPGEPEEPSSVSGEHLPLGRHDQKNPDGWSASREVLDASYPSRRRRQVRMRRIRQIPIPFVVTARPNQPESQKPSKINVGKGQGEYHGTVLGAVFIKPKPKTTISPITPFFIRRP